MSSITVSTPRGKGALILNAHPEGMKALANQQILAAKAELSHPIAGARGKTALIIGSTSPGYGSATAIALRAAGFQTIIGLGYEPQRPALKGDSLTASPGWYFTQALHQQNIVDRTYFADAFSDETRARVLGDMAARGECLDLVVYSLAAGLRNYEGTTWRSALKVIGDPLDVTALKHNMTQFNGASLERQTVAAATLKEIDDTVRVMGGDDLDLWIGALLMKGLLKEGAFITARSYIGPEGLSELKRLYWNGTIGEAKKHIDATTRRRDAQLREMGVHILSEVDPAVVTMASAAIPAISKYLAAYLAVASGGVGVYRTPVGVSLDLVRALYGAGQPWKGLLDDEGRLRLDGHEMRPDLQAAILDVWNLNNEPSPSPTDVLGRGLDRYRQEYLKLFGFGVEGVDYTSPFNFDDSLADGIVDLLSPQQPAPKAIVSVPETIETTPKVNSVSDFFDALLSRDHEPGVTVVEEEGRKVFVSEYTFDPQQVRRYAEVTDQPQDGMVPAAMTFVMAFPNILDAVKDIIRSCKMKSVVHVAEEPTMASPMRAEGKVTLRAWAARKLGKAAPYMTFVDYEILDKEGAKLASARTTLAIGGDLSKLPMVLAKPEDLTGELLSKVTMTQPLIALYSEASGDTNPIHMSLEAAKALGLSSTIAHGMLTLGLANRDHVLSYKATWKTPVVPGDVLEFRRIDDKKIVGIITRGDQKYLAIELTKKTG